MEETICKLWGARGASTRGVGERLRGIHRREGSRGEILEMQRGAVTCPFTIRPFSFATPSCRRSFSRAVARDRQQAAGEVEGGSAHGDLSHVRFQTTKLYFERRASLLCVFCGLRWCLFLNGRPFSH
jgi:hypothetical protein